MKNTILFLFLFITLISCSKQNKNKSISDQLESAKNNIEKKNNEITINYSTPIKGYNVSAKWIIRKKNDAYQIICLFL